MKDEPINTNGSLEIATALQRHIPFFHSIGRKLGQTATGAIVKTHKILTKDIALPRPSLAQIKQVLWNDSISRQKLFKIVERSNEQLVTATTVFPIDVFPDTIILDRTKLTITRRSFLMADVMSIRIEDILNVSATVGPFFGSLTFATRVLSSDDHFTIRHLWKDDVLHLKHVIQGYVIACQNNLETDSLSREELVETLCELGQDSHRSRMMQTIISSRSIQ